MIRKKKKQETESRAKEKQLEPADSFNQYKRRMIILGLVFFIAFVVVFGRLYFLMIVKHDQYLQMAETQYKSVSKYPAVRGEIRVSDRYSDNSFPVAVSVKKITAYANPKRITNPLMFVDAVSKELGIKLEDETVAKLYDKSKSYVPLKRRLSIEERDELASKKIDGLEFDPEYVRIYPQKSFLSHILGFVGYKGDDRVGLYGLEKQYEDILAGIDGFSVTSVGSGLMSKPDESRNAVNGGSMIITIDKSIQFNAEKIIEEAVVANQADSGSIVVLEPNTGKLIAAAVYPDFDPNEYNKVEDLGVFSNQVTTSAYEPGSVFKPITMAIGIDLGLVNPNSTYVDEGVVEVDGFKIKNSDKLSHGKQTMSQVLEKSLNTGMIFVEDLIGDSRFYRYVKLFGFGELTGVDLPESKGSIENISGNIKVNFDTASFGQGILITPIQLVRAFSAIANKGLLPTPYIVSSIIDANGNVKEVTPKNPEQVISADTAKTITSMMVSVVENGHGKKAAVPGYYVAGKTGTAQVAKKNGVGYEEDINVGSFIGFAPANKPRFVALVRVNHPKNVKFAESTAAPAFGKLAKFILEYYGVEPERK